MIDNLSETNKIVQLLRELLLLSSNETKGEVLIECGKCIGEIGAIDPSRINAQIVNSRLKNRVDQFANILPWTTDKSSFGLCLLKNYLVPSLKASVTHQDRIGYAIQTVLQELSKVFSTTEDTSKEKRKPKQMPLTLLKDLVQAKIAHVVEPFFKTNYSLKNIKDVIKPPVYLLNVSYPYWIGLWAKYLSSISEGECNVYFKACKGAVRNQADLSQFLLPYLIYDILSQKNDNSDERYEEVIVEICLVLSDGDTSVFDKYDMKLKYYSLKSKNVMDRPESNYGESRNDMAVQATFQVIHVLNNWYFSYNQGQVKDRDSSNSKDKNKPQTERITYTLNRIEKLINDIPKKLLGDAACRIKAYASSLRYFEIYAREINRENKTKSRPSLSTSKSNSSSKSNKQINSRTEASVSVELFGEPSPNVLSAGRNDGSNHELPNLASDQIDQFMDIYSKLEDPDALQGYLVLRQILGYPSNYWCRILEYEQTENWQDALNEYGLAHTMITQRLDHNLNHFLFNHQENLIVESSNNKRKIDSRSHSMTNKVVKPNSQLFVTPNFQGKKSPISFNSIDTHSQVVEGRQPQKYSIKDLGSIEKGRLKCLIELDHLDTAFSQAMKLINQLPEIQSSIIPVGVEAAWRLADWKSLDHSLSLAELFISKSPDISTSVTNYRILPEGSFQIHLGELFRCIGSKNFTEFNKKLSLTRAEIMGSLSAACKESYGRSYPYITRLQILSEIEDGSKIVDISHDMRNEYLNNLEWKSRLEMMSTAYQPITTTLAVRRSILQISGMPQQLAENWLDMSRLMRKMGRYDIARLALRKAGIIGLGPHSNDILLLEECHLLKAEGEINQALKLLEPVELNPYELAEQFKAIKDDKHSSNVSTVPINPGFKEILMDEHQRNQFAQKLHLATQLMVESRQKHGRIIIERYNLVLSIQKHNEAVRYELGRYFESLYSDIKEKKINEEFQIRGSNSNQVSSNPNTVSSLGLSSGSSYSFDDSSSYLHFALRSYILSLKNHNLNMITQALPRMLTLWFSFTSLRDDSANSSNRKSSSGLSPLVKVQREVNTLIAAGAVKISAYTWFHCMPQLVSRIGHNNPGTVEIIQSILLRILVEYPKQGVWHIAGLLHSLNDERVEVGRQLVKQACEGLVQSERKGEAEMLRQASRLFEELDKLASFQTKEKRIRYSLGEGISLTHFLVPSQQTLLNLPVPVDQGQETKESLLYYQSNHHYIQNFHDIVEVAASKARPKIIQLTTTAGKTVKFLLKQEKNGDLRKDARMMEFNSVINRILVEDAEGRKRDLRLRTYAVVCLNEECGLLEWVNNTSCLRHLIIESHGFFKNMEYPFLNPKDVITSFPEIQTLYKGNLERMVDEYRKLILDKFKPCFHRWFLEKFHDPTQWLEARSRFTRSVAVWSSVGHIIGLGDRHTENVLLDVTNGECVHVDFDCLFDKGLTLQRPEIVPFRLTPNMVDAMGVTGIEGIFRCTMEVCLQLLRQNKDVLLSVLEPFLRDPTVAWSRSGRAQRSEASSSTKSTATFHDRENADAKEALLKISGRLNGVYNIVNPAAEDIKREYRVREKAYPNRGLGASKDEELPLSVSGQVQRLISEAIMEENLAQMFIGWQPWM